MPLVNFDNFRKIFRQMKQRGYVCAYRKKYFLVCLSLLCNIICHDFYLTTFFFALRMFIHSNVNCAIADEPNLHQILTLCTVHVPPTQKPCKQLNQNFFDYGTFACLSRILDFFMPSEDLILFSIGRKQNKIVISSKGLTTK